jgi:hypothetical protein
MARRFMADLELAACLVEDQDGAIVYTVTADFIRDGDELPPLLINDDELPRLRDWTGGRARLIREAATVADYPDAVEVNGHLLVGYGENGPPSRVAAQCVRCSQSVVSATPRASGEGPVAVFRERSCPGASVEGVRSN